MPAQLPTPSYSTRTLLGSPTLSGELICFMSYIILYSQEDIVQHITILGLQKESLPTSYEVFISLASEAVKRFTAHLPLNAKILIEDEDRALRTTDSPGYSALLIYKRTHALKILDFILDKWNNALSSCPHLRQPLMHLMNQTDLPEHELPFEKTRLSVAPYLVPQLKTGNLYSLDILRSVFNIIPIALFHIKWMDKQVALIPALAASSAPEYIQAFKSCENSSVFLGYKFSAQLEVLDENFKNYVTSEENIDFLIADVLKDKFYPILLSQKTASFCQSFKQHQHQITEIFLKTEQARETVQAGLFAQERAQKNREKHWTSRLKFLLPNTEQVLHGEQEWQKWDLLYAQHFSDVVPMPIWDTLKKELSTLFVQMKSPKDRSLFIDYLSQESNLWTLLKSQNATVDASQKNVEQFRHRSWPDILDTKECATFVNIFRKIHQDPIFVDIINIVSIISHCSWFDAAKFFSQPQLPTLDPNPNQEILQFCYTLYQNIMNDIPNNPEITSQGRYISFISALLPRASAPIRAHFLENLRRSMDFIECPYWIQSFGYWLPLDILSDDKIPEALKELDLRYLHHSVNLEQQQRISARVYKDLCQKFCLELPPLDLPPFYKKLLSVNDNPVIPGSDSYIEKVGRCVSSLLSPYESSFVDALLSFYHTRLKVLSVPDIFGIFMNALFPDPDTEEDREDTSLPFHAPKAIPISALLKDLNEQEEPLARGFILRANKKVQKLLPKKSHAASSDQFHSLKQVPPKDYFLAQNYQREANNHVKRMVEIANMIEELPLIDRNKSSTLLRAAHDKINQLLSVTKNINPDSPISLQTWLSELNDEEAQRVKKYLEDAYAEIEVLFLRRKVSELLTPEEQTKSKEYNEKTFQSILTQRRSVLQKVNVALKEVEKAENEILDLQRQQLPTAKLELEQLKSVERQTQDQIAENEVFIINQLIDIGAHLSTIFNPKEYDEFQQSSRADQKAKIADLLEHPISEKERRSWYVKHLKLSLNQKKINDKLERQSQQQAKKQEALAKRRKITDLILQKFKNEKDSYMKEVWRQASQWEFHKNASLTNDFTDEIAQTITSLPEEDASPPHVMLFATACMDITFQRRLFSTASESLEYHKQRTSFLGKLFKVINDETPKNTPTWIQNLGRLQKTFEKWYLTYQESSSEEQPQVSHRVFICLCLSIFTNGFSDTLLEDPEYRQFRSQTPYPSYVLHAMQHIVHSYQSVESRLIFTNIFDSLPSEKDTSFYRKDLFDFTYKDGLPPLIEVYFPFHRTTFLRGCLKAGLHLDDSWHKEKLFTNPKILFFTVRDIPVGQGDFRKDIFCLYENPILVNHLWKNHAQSLPDRSSQSIPQLHISPPFMKAWWGSLSRVLPQGMMQHQKYLQMASLIEHISYDFPDKDKQFWVTHLIDFLKLHSPPSQHYIFEHLTVQRNGKISYPQSEVTFSSWRVAYEEARRGPFNEIFFTKIREACQGLLPDQDIEIWGELTYDNKTPLSVEKYWDLLVKNKHIFIRDGRTSFDIQPLKDAFYQSEDHWVLPHELAEEVAAIEHLIELSPLGSSIPMDFNEWKKRNSYIPHQIYEKRQVANEWAHFCEAELPNLIANNQMDLVFDITKEFLQTFQALKMSLSHMDDLLKFINDYEKSDSSENETTEETSQYGDAFSLFCSNPTGEVFLFIMTCLDLMNIKFEQEHDEKKLLQQTHIILHLLKEERVKLENEIDFWPESPALPLLQSVNSFTGFEFSEEDQEKDDISLEEQNLQSLRKTALSLRHIQEGLKRESSRQNRAQQIKHRTTKRMIRDITASTLKIERTQRFQALKTLDPEKVTTSRLIIYDLQAHCDQTQRYFKSPQDWPQSHYRITT